VTLPEHSFMSGVEVRRYVGFHPLKTIVEKIPRKILKKILRTFYL